MSQQGIPIRKGICAHCGDQSNHITDDHVPPRLLYPKPRPETLFTVPSCRKCGPGASKDEEYFRDVILQREGIPQIDKIEKLNGAMLRSALRGRGPLPTILSQTDILENVTVDGFVRPQIGLITPDMQRVDRVLKKITTGLSYILNDRTPLPDDYEVSVLYHSGSRRRLHKEQHDFVRGLLELFRDKTQVTYVGDPDIFVFSCAVSEDDSFTSLWYLGIFGHAGFITSVLPGDAMDTE